MSKYWSPGKAALEDDLEGLNVKDLSDYTLSAAAIERGDVFTVGKPVVQPIVHSSTYKVKSVKEYQDVYDKGGYMYLRYNNATNEQAELSIKLLEKAAGSLVFSCGMAAISTALMTYLNNGDHMVVCNPLYSGTHDFISKVLPRYGITSTFIDGYDVESYRKAVQPNTKVLYGETPSNPILSVTDLAGLAGLAKELNQAGQSVVTMIDSTFASPFLQKPIEHGIDVVIHSATKYLGGHSDLCAGVVSVKKKEDWNKLIVLRRSFGCVLSPFDGYLLLRGTKTLPLRVTRQSETALKLAEFLEKHPAIEKVHYPGLPSHPGHELAKKQMKMFGGMVAFEVKGGLEPAQKFVEALRIIQLAVSLGGTESLVEHPATMSHGHMIMTPEERRLAHISDGQVRLSCGLEDYEDLKKDIFQALDKAVRI